MSAFLLSMNTEDVKKRWAACWDAKQDELDRIEKAYLWLYEFERHLRRGEEGDQIYRFPEIMGYGLRRFNEFLQILPEARATGSGDGAIGLQAAVDHVKTVSNLDAIKMAILGDSTFMGNGCMQVMPFTWRRKFKDGKEKVGYSGLAAERVDWRHFFPAPGYKMIHDHTGKNTMPYCFRRKIYNFGTFKQLAEQQGWNIDGIEATTWENANVWGDDNWTSSHETQEYSAAIEFVTVLEYWDIVADELRYYATGGKEIFVEKDGIPCSHKQLPFHHYRNVYRLDSLNGIGEIEINMPYNLFRERILNLAADDITLQVQPAWIVDEDINFNPDEHELQGNAVFSVRGTAGGKLQDHIMPFRPGGGVSSQVMSIVQMIENSRIAVTSDDTTSLYSNPNQLATQTLAKMQNLNKSVDGSTKQNIYNTEFYLTNQIVSYLKNELSEPYYDGKKTKFHKIKIKGYDVLQDSEKEDVKFVKGYGAAGMFSLNQKTSEMFDEEEIEVIPAQKDEELKRDQTEKLNMAIQSVLQTVTALAQNNPQAIQEIIGNMNLPELIKTQFKNLGLGNELKDIFPIIMKDKAQLDAIDAEHEQIMMGTTPEVRPDEDSMDEFDKHVKFENSTYFQKNASAKAKESMKKHKIKTLENAQVQKSKPVTDQQKGLAGTQVTSQQYGVQAPGSMVEEQAAPSGTRASLQQTKGEMERGVLSRSA